jgi:hypothetical protein
LFRLRRPQWSLGQIGRDEHQKGLTLAGCWWLMPVIQLLRRQRSGGPWFESSPGKKKFMRPYLKKPFTKIGRVE